MKIGHRFAKIMTWCTVSGFVFGMVSSFFADGQYKKSEMKPPAPAVTTVNPTKNKKKGANDSIPLRYRVKPQTPRDYDDLGPNHSPIDLRQPSNIKTDVEFDPETGCYVVRTKLGDTDIATPFMLSEAQYNDLEFRKSMQQYYQKRNSELLEKKQKEPFNILDMNFALGPLEKVFGPGGLQLKTQGSVQLSMGIKSNKTDNPALPLSSRRKTYFDFDQKIQATINAAVGDKLKFNMSYNTDATFDFDTKNLKLQFEGKEDDIIKNIEAGNVSMTTGSSLIKGSTALFGIKTKLQFGKLTATALVSQQNSESKTVNTKGGVQTTEFKIKADEYDQNRHYFLSQYFHDNYDRFASKLPFVSSGVNITRIEVWVTNKSNNFDQSRNIVAFMDLGENSKLACNHWIPNPSLPNPANASNNMLSTIKENYPDARIISKVSTALEPLEVYGFEGGRDYEKIESARLLSSNDYTLNASLGYISLKSALNADEVLAVAFQYTYNGEVYQVGEFSGDVTSNEQSLYVKMLKGTTVAPRLPMWHLMMKNVYSLGGYQIQKSNFKMNIKYLSDTTGTEIVYLPVEGLNTTTLLQLMNLDRLDKNEALGSDGFFDYLEGYTAISSTGKIIFPVAEPFGSHLESKIPDPVTAKKFVYHELYDSTITVARQYADKNKFILKGEYQASSGSQIRLNAMNVPRGSVVVTAGGVKLTENSDYTVDYVMGIVTITNQSIIDSGQSISVSLENQSLFSMQRKTLLGLDLNYKFSKNFNIGATLMHFSEKALTEKVSIGDEIINNTIWGANISYNSEFMWLTNLLNKIPTVNASAPSSISFTGEFAQLLPHKQKTGSAQGSSYVDDFESSQSGIDLRSPYSWFLASTPYDPSPSALFPEAKLSNNVDYGKNRSLLAWNFIDRMFTQKNSNLAPSYIQNDLEQLSSPEVREVSSREIFPGRELNYGESSTIQTLNLSFYPNERGPYNLDGINIDEEGRLLYPERRWGGIMRKMDNTNFEQSNIEYVQFWMMNPFTDPKMSGHTGGDLYFNLGEMSEDILKDGLKSYENGLPVDGSDTKTTTTVWGRVSTQNSLTYAFDNAEGARRNQDVGLNGLSTEQEFSFPTYQEYLNQLRTRLSPATIEKMQADKFSPLNDPAGDNYHFYRGYDYDEQRLSILERYKRYNGTEGNSLSPEDAGDALYQSARSVPDVEDINQDNTLNEYERYYQYKVSIRPADLVVGKNYITDKQVSRIRTRNGKDIDVEWIQFKIPLHDYEKVVGSITDFSTIRFARMFLTGFSQPIHLRFATLELVRGEWRNYDFNLNSRSDVPAEGKLDMSVVNIEENAGRTPVNYVLPPGVTRIVDPGQSQITQLNEQSMMLRLTGIQAGDARGVYRNTSLDLRNYKRLQMWVHAEQFINDVTNLKNGELSVFVRMGSDVKSNFYEYSIPLSLTPAGHYNNESTPDRYKVWPEENRLDFVLQNLVELKKKRNLEMQQEGSGVGYGTLYTQRDPDNERNTMSMIGNPSLSNVRVVLIGVRNNSSTVKDGTIWVNELKVTDFNESGGWAAKANLNIAISDIATVNAGAHIETAGFGAVDQSLNSRRLDDYRQMNVAVQADIGRFLPEKVKLKAPVYYSVSKEKVTPKYNPLDQDVLLKDALDGVDTKEEKDSINAYAVQSSTIRSFSISGLKFDVKSKKPMPWDPTNFTFNFSFNKQEKIDPTIEYEYTNDYRGSFQYSYTPYAKPLKPFGWLKTKNKNLKFFTDYEIAYLPASISFQTNMSRYYYEQQTRSECDVFFRMPVSVSKNFLWDRQLAITWNPIKSLNLTFNSNTNARIEEPMGAVNKKLFPDEYKHWKDSVIHNLLHMGTPWTYNQSFVASYKAPFNRIPVLDFLTANGSYNATYQWQHGAEVEGVNIGHTIQNQRTINADGRITFESLYKKIPYLKDVDKRFSSTSRKSTPKKPRKFERTFQLKADTTLTIKHNLRSRKVKVVATTTDGKPFVVRTKVIDQNQIEVLTMGDQNLKFVITEVLKDDKSFLREVLDYSTRFLMLTRSASIRWRQSQSMTIPLFKPQIGNIFGQTNSYGPMAPGLDFAFGFVDDDYLYRIKDRGWLLCEEGQTSPAIISKTNEINLELNLEPIKGLKIQLTGNRTDNRTSQIQFMYDQMPISRTGSYTKTHAAIATALRFSSPDNGYESRAFNDFINNIPIVAERLQSQYVGSTYPDAGFIHGTPYAGAQFDPTIGGINSSSSDVLIPAFLAAYSGINARKVNLNPFPSLASILPNWRVTYDGFINIGNLRDKFKTITLTHAYQCTYSVGSYSSYLNWLSLNGSELQGFALDEASGKPIPSSPFNISSVAITEKFAPLAGVNVTLKNDMKFTFEYRDSRTLTLNSSAGQIVEANTKGIVAGIGYKIIGFNTILKMKNSGKGVSNDLTLNADFQFNHSQALIRNIESRLTQATSGTKSITVNFTANYVLSKRLTLSAFFDHQINTPLVSANSYPTTNSSYGISVNLSLAR